MDVKYIEYDFFLQYTCIYIYKNIEHAIQDYDATFVFFLTNLKIKLTLKINLNKGTLYCIRFLNESCCFYEFELYTCISILYQIGLTVVPCNLYQLNKHITEIQQ